MAFFVVMCSKLQCRLSCRGKRKWLFTSMMSINKIPWFISDCAGFRAIVMTSDFVGVFKINFTIWNTNNILVDASLVEQQGILFKGPILCSFFRIIPLFQVSTTKCLHALMSRNHVVFLTLSISQSRYMLTTRLSYQEGGGDGRWSFRGGGCQAGDHS